MKIVITGGHLSPALSLIDLINGSPRGEAGRHDVLFIGRKYGFEGDSALSLEYKLLQKLGVNFASVAAGRFQRSFTRYTIPSLFKIPIGFYQSFKILRAFAPDVFVGFGGYVSFAPALASFILRIPIVIHEQTLEAGTTNRIVSHIAEKICISFENSRQFFPKGKTILTGNPIRAQIIKPQSNLELPYENIPLIYFTGGSLGSIFINELIEKTLKDLLSKYRIIHQAGSFNNNKSLQKLRKIKKNLNNQFRKRYLVTDHFSADDVGKILREATLVVGRSGINTITELLFLNKPALLIPLSTGQHDEQRKNAQFLKEAGLAEVLNENAATPTDFVKVASHMIDGIDSYKANENKEYLKENASENILRVVENAAKKTDEKTS